MEGSWLDDSAEGVLKNGVDLALLQSTQSMFAVAGECLRPSSTTVAWREYKPKVRGG